MNHSLSTLQLSPHTVWLIVFGGASVSISLTIIVELCEYIHIHQCIDMCVYAVIILYAITLCTYTQQGYAFGHISLCMYTCICMYTWQKSNLFVALPFGKILLSVSYFLLMEFKCLQSGFPHPASCTDEAIHACSIKTSPGILHYSMPCLIVMTCSSSAKICLRIELRLISSPDHTLC